MAETLPGCIGLEKPIPPNDCKKCGLRDYCRRVKGRGRVELLAFAKVEVLKWRI